MPLDEILPALDCHAHIAPDVTPRQVAALGGAFVFAMTRSLGEAEAVVGRSDRRLVWGCGTHPADPEALAAFDARRFNRLLSGFAVVGEVGLDGRAGNKSSQLGVFRDILDASAKHQVLVSIHSSGAEREVVEQVLARELPGVILHWFRGSKELVDRAAAAGCYFSASSALSDDQLLAIPLARLLPETDFPTGSRKGGMRRPADTSRLEARLSDLHGLTADEIRMRSYRNLADLADAAGVLGRLPSELVDALLSV